MSVMFRPVGMLKSYVGGQDVVAIEAGISVREALMTLGIPPELVALVVVNEEQESKDYILQDGDSVRVMALMGGG